MLMKKTWPIIIILLILAFTILMASQFKAASAKSADSTTITLLSPVDHATFNALMGSVGFQVRYETKDVLSWVGYSIDGGSNVTVSGNNTYVNGVENNGYHTFTLYANDTSGNWAAPQTATYQVIFISSVDSPFYFAVIAIISVVLVIVVVVVVLLHKKHRRNVSLGK
jgi:hypothetical protein